MAGSVKEAIETLSLNIASHQQEQYDLLDEQLAVIANLIKPGTYEPCWYCDNITSRPHLTFEKHGIDICSPSCLRDYLEEEEDDRWSEATETASKKVEGFKDWDRVIHPAYYNEEVVEYKGLKILEVELTRVDCQEQRLVIDIDPSDNETIVVPLANADSNYVCSCECLKCQHKFELNADVLLASKRKNQCPECSKK